MSATAVDAPSAGSTSGAAETAHKAPSSKASNYKGFVAGVFSGIAKLSGKTFDAELRVSQNANLNFPIQLVNHVLTIS